MVARYNVFFNGTLKLDEAKNTLQEGHTDDYTKILEVFPYGAEESRKGLAPQMDEVIKKASKVIADRPISKWVDDSYLLMGKAYFFKADYFAAIETFQYINSRYKGTRLSYEATVWIIKCYVMLGKEREAEAIIGLMNTDPEFPEKLKPFLHEASASVYIKEGKYKAAAEALEKALPFAKGSAKKARFHYILGQLYENLGERSKAREHYRLVTKGSPPYEMAFQAKINLARNYNRDDKSEIRAARKYMKSMLRDDKNTSYFPQIYYELGMIEKNENNLKQAIAYFILSNESNTNNPDQKAVSFLEIAGIYFAQPEYRLAQAYYDSAVYFLKPEHKDYQLLKAKQEVLSELIKNLILIQKEDSLLKVAELPKKEIDNLIDKAIKEEQERQEELKKKKEEQKNAPNLNPLIPANPFNQPPVQAPASRFYFSDPVLVARGFSDFTKRWGERQNVDNWQFSALAERQVNPDDPGDPNPPAGGTNPEVPGEGPADSASLVRQQYLNSIPFSPEAKTSSLARIAEAYLKVGEIYYEQLKDLPEAEKNFTTFLSRFPKHTEVPKALFYLYKLYKEQGKTELADQYKAKLITGYPESPFTRYLTNDIKQESQTEGMDPAIVKAYSDAYDDYKKGLYPQVIQRKTAFDKTYFGTPLQPKFDFLEGMAYARMDSAARSISVLEKLVVTYPTSMEAFEAQRIISAYKKNQGENALKEVTSTQYVFNPSGKHFFLMLLPERKRVSTSQLKARFSDFNKNSLPDMSLVVEELAVGERQFIVVKEFNDMAEAQSYLDIVVNNAEFMKSLAAPGAEFLVGDPKNLGLMVVNSDLKGYLQFYSTYYSK